MFEFWLWLVVAAGGLITTLVALHRRRRDALRPPQDATPETLEARSTRRAGWAGIGIVVVLVAAFQASQIGDELGLLDPCYQARKAKFEGRRDELPSQCLNAEERAALTSKSELEEWRRVDAEGQRVGQERQRVEEERQRVEQGRRRLVFGVCNGEPIADAPAYGRTPGLHSLRIQDYSEVFQRDVTDKAADSVGVPELVLCARPTEHLVETCYYRRPGRGFEGITLRRVSRTIRFELRETRTAQVLATRSVAGPPPRRCPMTTGVLMPLDRSFEVDATLSRWLDGYVDIHGSESGGH